MLKSIFRKTTFLLSINCRLYCFNEFLVENGIIYNFQKVEEMKNLEMTAKKLKNHTTKIHNQKIFENLNLGPENIEFFDIFEAVNVKIIFEASAFEFDEQRLNKRKHELELDRQLNKALDCGVNEVYKNMSLYPKALSKIPHIKTTLVKRLSEEYLKIIESRIHIVLARAMELNPSDEDVALELIENAIA